MCPPQTFLNEQMAIETAARFKTGCDYLSHEIRNQLFPFSQILHSRDLSEDNIEAMIASLDTVSSILNSTLTVAQISARGYLEADKAWFRLDRLRKATALFGRSGMNTCSCTCSCPSMPMPMHMPMHYT